ncbi:unnamed protein product [Camellia sinensis]
MERLYPNRPTVLDMLFLLQYMEGVAAAAKAVSGDKTATRIAMYIVGKRTFSECQNVEWIHVLIYAFAGLSGANIM